MRDLARETALLLSHIGLPIFECRGKVPAAEGWKAATSPEPDTAATWRSYGIPCGRKSGCWVLDIDTKNGAPGMESLAALEAEHGPLPATMVVETPSGGRHYFFRFEEGLRIGNRAGDIAAGVDVRGHDEAGAPLGYVCGPGSQLDNGTYRVISGSEMFPAGLPPAPDWLLYLAGFNKSDRAKLAELGIHGAADFAGAPPKAWKALAGKFLSVPRPERKATGEAPAPVSGDEVLRYIKPTIERLLSDLLATAGPSNRNIPANNTALKIHGDLKGAIEKGADVGAVADLENWAHAEFLAVCIEIKFEADKPNPGKLAEELWQRCKRDAKPRNLDHVGRKTADAASQFTSLPGAEHLGAIDLPSANVKPRFRFVDDEPPIQPIDYLIDDLIPERSFGFIAGASGSGKSAVALDLAFCLARGQPFFGRAAVKPSGVLVIAGEHGYGIPPRIEAAKRGRYGAEPLPIVFAEPGSALADANELKSFVEDMKAAGKAMEGRYGVPCRLIVVDTLSASFAIEDENSAGQAKQAITVARALGEALGATVLVVHHHGKNAEAGMRGSSAYFAAADFVITIAKKKSDPVGKISLDKSRDSADGIEIGQFALEPIQVATKPDGSPFTQVFIRPVIEGFETMATAEPDDDISKTWLAALREAVEASGVDHVTGDGVVVRAVRQAEVRAAFYKIYGAGGTRNENTIKMAFQRGLERLGERIGRFGSKKETLYWHVAD